MKNNSDNIQLSNLVDMDNPDSVLNEVKEIAALMSPGFDPRPVERVFEDVLRLFRGEFPGYRKCNTEYHDLKHTTDTFLAFARLMHGAFIKGHHFKTRNITLGLISALMHDTGYMQTMNDDTGTGAKYTLQHISRSIAFMDKYFRDKEYYSGEDFDHCGQMLNCTGFSANVGSIGFKSDEVGMLGKILGTADLLGQMADRNYLEKLIFLYNEFHEGQVQGFADEFDLLKKTISFYDIIKNRFVTELGSVNRYMVCHFEERWNINRDLYLDAIEKNIGYLKGVIDGPEKDYRAHFRRSSIIQRSSA